MARISSQPPKQSATRGSTKASPAAANQAKPSAAKSEAAKSSPRDDGFEAAQTKLARPAQDDRRAAAFPLRASEGALHVLNSAREPGVFFREPDPEGHRRDEDEAEDPELAAAVEECIRLLFGVRGIQRVGPGLDESGEKVILITPMRGFGESSLRAIPERVHRFKTLVALPFDLLPLRRES